MFQIEGIAFGGDYNPDQWLDRPDILREDLRLMQKAGCSLFSVGIFAWARLEPEEGRYDFDWLEEILDKMHQAGLHVLLATPSGARPAWLSQRYPEVQRVLADGSHMLIGGRHNHCFTSPVYRRKVRAIDTALAERFGRHPAVVGWHISNEYSGECHCPMCQEAFRAYLMREYGSLDALNRAWWTSFWSKTYTDISQLHSPSPRGETAIHGLTLAWRRFVTEQTADFMRMEVEAVRAACPELPVTANLMEDFWDIDYFRFAREMDVVAYDSYPRWGVGDVEDAMMDASFNYDTMRSLKKQPFALMESTPSQVNWQNVCRLKRPGMNLLSSLQAVAHGADMVGFFQWRKSRGCAEKFHGAVVGHDGREDNRVFREVCQLGDALRGLAEVAGSDVPARAALVYDWQNRWALDDQQGPRADMHYREVVRQHYTALKRLGLGVDIVDEDSDLSGYDLVAAPMLYMVRAGLPERLEAFVRGGGTLVTGCRTGCVDRDDLCFEGGFPGPLRELLGILYEDTDALPDDMRNGIALNDGASAPCRWLCDVIEEVDAEVLGVYEGDFYKGTPTLTRKCTGDGQALYLASCPDTDFLERLYARLTGRSPLPRGVQMSTRARGGDAWLFCMNFNERPVTVDLPRGNDAFTGLPIGGKTELAGTSCRVLRLKGPVRP